MLRNSFIKRQDDITIFSRVKTYSMGAIFVKFLIFCEVTILRTASTSFSQTKLKIDLEKINKWKNQNSIYGIQKNIITDPAII